MLLLTGVYILQSPSNGEKKNQKNNKKQQSNIYIRLDLLVWW